ncbi:stage II sporulation protein R [Anaerovorax odorimutans]|uniref:stage II sporulation protein R n=1 Tax=Anaerovorax odorimutans TaxID=109327 RepID=UPI0003F9C4E8|nr:stage II sporulation protein R [Anaerovorax odorimutans]
MEIRRKQIIIFALVIITILLYTSWNVYNKQNSLSNEDFIRFHVIANSDTKEDQALKLKVRDGVLVKVNKDLAVEAMARHDGNSDIANLNIEQSREYIKENLKDIETAAEEIVKENGYDYTVKAELGVRWIPEKTYGDVTFPAGNYEALNLIIGEGKGQNWWCVLFPPLCLIGVSQPTEANPETAINTDCIDAKYDVILKNDGKPVTLKLKFKSLELIDELDRK